MPADNPTAPNLSAASEADARLRELECMIGRMLGAAKALKCLAVPAVWDADEAPRYHAAVEWIADALDRDLNRAMDMACGDAPLHDDLPPAARTADAMRAESVGLILAGGKAEAWEAAISDARHGCDRRANPEPRPMPPAQPSDLSALDMSAFGLAFAEECARADQHEPIGPVIDRAMSRVRLYLAERDRAQRTAA